MKSDVKEVISAFEKRSDTLFGQKLVNYLDNKKMTDKAKFVVSQYIASVTEDMTKNLSLLTEVAKVMSINNPSLTCFCEIEKYFRGERGPLSILYAMSSSRLSLEGKLTIKSVLNKSVGMDERDERIMGSNKWHTEREVIQVEGTDAYDLWQHEMMDVRVYKDKNVARQVVRDWYGKESDLDIWYPYFEKGILAVGRD